MDCPTHQSAATAVQRADAEEGWGADTLDESGFFRSLLGMFNIIGADQQQYGPVSAEQIRQWIADGRANAQTLCSAEGSAEWKPLGSFPEFADSLRQQPPPHPPTLTHSLAAPGPAQGFGQPQPDVPNYLVQAILVTLCCCIPFGVVALVYAAQVKSKLGNGDINGAMAASKNARLWCWLALVFGIVSNVVSIIYIFSVGFENFRRGMY